MGNDNIIKVSLDVVKNENTKIDFKVDGIQI